jgi:hypothetical protein
MITLQIFKCALRCLFYSANIIKVLNQIINIILRVRKLHRTLSYIVHNISHIYVMYKVIYSRIETLFSISWFLKKWHWSRYKYTISKHILKEAGCSEKNRLDKSFRIVILKFVKSEFQNFWIFCFKISFSSCSLHFPFCSQHSSKLCKR